MKLRTNKNSIRLRLSQIEVANFQKFGIVEESLSFSDRLSDCLHYSLIEADHDQINVTFNNNHLRVYIPSQIANAWCSSEQVGFDAKIVRHDMKPLGSGRRIVVILIDGHAGRQFAVLHFRRCRDLCEQTGGIGIDRRNSRPHRTLIANVADQGTRVDVLDADDRIRLQIILQRHRRAKVRNDPARLADDKALDPRPTRFDIFGVRAVVADERVRHTDDLPRVAWVGQDLLIAGHRGVKDHLAKCLAVSPK